MKDNCINTLAPSVTKMGTTAINNSTPRWFAQRYGVGTAWFFGGYYGTLGSFYVNNTYRCQAVALLDID
jgi:hypothetical protein